MSDHDSRSDSSPRTRKFSDNWLTATEASLKAVFQMQNASLLAGRSLVENWQAALVQSQDAVLEALQAWTRPPNRSSETAR